jgi:hypothetical protein
MPNTLPSLLHRFLLDLHELLLNRRRVAVAPERCLCRPPSGEDQHVTFIQIDLSLRT